MAFTQEETKQKVVAIIAEKLSMPAEQIKPESTFKNLGADSLDIVEIIMNFEETFGVEIKDEEAERIHTIQQAIDLIHQARTQ